MSLLLDSVFQGGKISKLAMAFQAFDDLQQYPDGGNGMLTRDLWRYLRSFLSAISSLCGFDRVQVQCQWRGGATSVNGSALEKQSISLTAIETVWL